MYLGFALFLFPIIIQRALILPLWIFAVVQTDFDQTPLSRAMDVTYSGIHAPTALKHIIILGWVLLAVATVSAFLERCYKLPKIIIVFIALATPMGSMTLNAISTYEPYLAIR